MRFEYGKKPEAAKSTTSSNAPRARKASHTATRGAQWQGDLTAVPAHASLGDWLGPVNGDIAAAPVHYPSPLPGRHHVRALTSDTGIHLAPEAGSLPRPELDALLAHEGAHVAQRSSGGAPAEPAHLESEAHTLAPEILAGRPVEPAHRAAPGSMLMDTAAEKAAVEAAKKRLALLSKYADEWAAREGNRLRSGKERDPMLAKRTKMDEGLPEPRGLREGMERQNLQKLNRAPLDIQLSDDEVRFRVKFQVRFEDQKMESRFDEVKASLESGIRSTWNQQLKGEVFGGRKFVVEPVITKVAGNAKRDQNFWLVTVRADDTGKVNYPGCSLPQPDPSVPTSVTDSGCDGGVMSIPPRHISKPDILGHELLHLFGLVDRYMALYRKVPGKKTTVETAPSRETGGRKDPLGAEQGTILREDLTFLFENLGVYQMEENRGLDTLRQLEAQGVTIYDVRAEMHRQQDIIDRGGKQPRLFKPRTDFRDKMIKTAEDL